MKILKIITAIVFLIADFCNSEIENDEILSVVVADAPANPNVHDLFLSILRQPVHVPVEFTAKLKALLERINLNGNTNPREPLPPRKKVCNLSLILPEK